jgi:hypothetical protein
MVTAYTKRAYTKPNPVNDTTTVRCSRNRRRDCLVSIYLSCSCWRCRRRCDELHLRAGGGFFRSVCCPEGTQPKEGRSPVEQHGLVSGERDEGRPA